MIKRCVILSSICLILLTVTTCVYASPRVTPVVKVVRENAEAVVNISTEKIVLMKQMPFRGRYNKELAMFYKQFAMPTKAMKTKSVGSGVIIDKNGIIVTNAHVVNMASDIYVILNNGRSYKGKVVYEDQANDIALIRIDPERKLKSVKFGATKDVMLGETVVAIGDSLGLQNSVTAGIVSGVNRAFYSSGGQLIYGGLLQTDAAINPGNSGGALLNLEGKMIGINVAVVQKSQSVGFAIPVEKIEKALKAYNKYLDSGLGDRKIVIRPKNNQKASRQNKWNPMTKMQQIQKKLRRTSRDKS